MKTYMNAQGAEIKLGEEIFYMKKLRKIVRIYRDKYGETKLELDNEAIISADDIKRMPK